MNKRNFNKSGWWWSKPQRVDDKTADYLDKLVELGIIDENDRDIELKKDRRKALDFAQWAYENALIGNPNDEQLFANYNPDREYDYEEDELTPYGKQLKDLYEEIENYTPAKDAPMTREDTLPIKKAAQYIFQKRAAVGKDMLRGTTSALSLPILAGRLTPGLAQTEMLAQLLAFPGGIAHGLASKAPSVEEVQKMDTNANRAFIPGVTTSRILRRRRALRRLLHNKPEALNLPVSEVSGQFISPITSGAIGGLIGGALGGGNGALNGGAIGLGVGLGGDVLGSLAAALTDRRSLAEQDKVENSKTRALLRHFIPGLAAYDMWKGIGATRNLSDRDPGEIYDEILAAKQRRERNEAKD